MWSQVLFGERGEERRMMDILYIIFIFDLNTINYYDKKKQSIEEERSEYGVKLREETGRLYVPRTLRGTACGVEEKSLSGHHPP